MKPHSKHKELSRLNTNAFSKYDVSFLCSEDTFILAHKLVANEIESKHSIKIIDKASLSSLLSNDIDKYTAKIESDLYDLALIHGTNKQILKSVVFLDSLNEDELKKQMRLNTNVLAFVSEGKQEPFNWIKHSITQELDSIPILNISELPKFLSKLLHSKKPELIGLVLAGGKSQRMGKDKSKIIYHKLSQDTHTAELLRSNGLNTYISKSSNNQETVEGFSVIHDSFVNLGPLGAICSAFQKFRNNAILVLACDLPYIDNSTIQLLIKERDPKKFATSIQSTEKEFPEPLITIYEPKAYRRLLNFMSLGYSCPRKMLINSEIKVLVLKDVKKLKNINTKSEMAEVMSEIKNRIDEE